MLLPIPTGAGAQVLHEGYTVLATKVHKLDVLYPGAEVHPPTRHIVAALGRVQEGHEVFGDDLACVRDPVCPRGTCSKLQERRKCVWPLLDKPEHQRVVSQAEFPQVGESDQALGEGLELVLVELEGHQLSHQGQLCG